MTLQKSDIVKQSVWIDDKGLTHRESTTSLIIGNKARQELASKVADELESLKNKLTCDFYTVADVIEDISRLQKTLRGGE